MCLYSFKEIIDRYNNAGSNVYCCFLDASRAYDRVSHKTLFKMLVTRNVPLIFIRILSYWYKHQTLFVKWGNCMSLSFCVTNGVRQGSVLSPYLFCIYVDKISKQLNSSKIGCKINDMLINHLFYADDLCLFSPSSKGLQVLLNICYSCADELSLIFNISKCKIMIFRCQQFRKCVVPRFCIGDKVLKECMYYKYLGYFITNTLSDDRDIDRQCRYFYAKGNSLVRRFYKCSDNVKVTLFKAYCSSLYSSFLWCRYTQATYRKVNVAYHGIFKKFLDYLRSTSNRFVFVYYNVPTFQELLRHHVFSFHTRLLKSENDLLLNLLNSRCCATSTLHRRWFSLLN